MKEKQETPKKITMYRNQYMEPSSFMVILNTADDLLKKGLYDKKWPELEQTLLQLDLRNLCADEIALWLRSTAPMRQYSQIWRDFREKVFKEYRRRRMTISMLDGMEDYNDGPFDYYSFKKRIEYTAKYPTRRIAHMKKARQNRRAKKKNGDQLSLLS